MDRCREAFLFIKSTVTVDFFHIVLTHPTFLEPKRYWLSTTYDFLHFMA